MTFLTVNLGQKITVLYEIIGWKTGIVKHYNTKLDKHLLVFDDDKTDLIKERDIDGVEMFFADQLPKRSKRVNYAALARGN